MRPCGAHCLDSSFKCNGWSEGREFFGHGFFGCFPSEGLAGSLVHHAGDVVEFGLADGAQVGALGEELARAVRWCSRCCHAAWGRVDRPSQMSIFSRRASSGWQAISLARS